MWFRVFGTNEAQPEPEALLEVVRQMGIGVTGKFHADDQGWFRAEFFLGAGNPRLQVERFLMKEEGMRAELNTWAAWLETVEQNPNHQWLMQHVISTAQLFTLQLPESGGKVAPLEKLAVEISRFLARKTAGVYQVDNEGFFAADGELLLQET